MLDGGGSAGVVDFTDKMWNHEHFALNFCSKCSSEAESCTFSLGFYFKMFVKNRIHEHFPLLILSKCSSKTHS